MLSRYADNDEDLWKRIDLKANECTSDSEWVVESAKHNKGRSSGGSSLSGLVGQHANAMQAQSGEAVGHPLLQNAAAGGAGAGAGAADSGIGAGCAYTQTPDEVEVVAPLPAGVSKKDVKVTFASARLEVRFAGKEEKLCGDLGGNVDLDGCTWTIDGSNLVISLEKRDSGKEWPFALRMD